MTTFVEVKTADLIGPALDWAVAQIEGVKTMMLPRAKGSAEKRPFALFGSLAYEVGGADQEYAYAPSSCWHCGGPLIHKYRPDLQTTVSGEFVAYLHNDMNDPDPLIEGCGDTLLIAACRAIVAAKLGDVVQVPAELVGSCVASDHDVPSAAQPRCRECDDRICNGTGVYEGRKTGIVGNQVARKFVFQDDQREVDELVALGIEQDKREIERLRAEVEALRAVAGMGHLLPELDDALEALELFGLHSDEGYRKLKEWYRKMLQAAKAIDAALAGKGGAQ